jgi:hypothetical protein
MHCRDSHKFTPVKSCLFFLYKLSVCYKNKCNAPFYDNQDDAVLGYESSWAGISKDAKMR